MSDWQTNLMTTAKAYTEANLLRLYGRQIELTDAEFEAYTAAMCPDEDEELREAIATVEEAGYVVTPLADTKPLRPKRKRKPLPASLVKKLQEAAANPGPNSLQHKTRALLGGGRVRFDTPKEGQ